ncbi:hypothetical protein AVEN_7430-1 [Araneus ventricosus]|uniref:Uncharacterized protein n=1 Tax=Araneus ventricosus TaxID=182803 RepID=A0A4Y2H410_ARAVE|nr:hypothetical protein AVEN_7430-1 [Araneus ventricosus]
MKGVVEVNVEWLPAFAPDLCDLNAPREDPPPLYDSSKDKIFCYMDGTFVLVIVTSRFEATQGLFWDGPRNFEPWSDDEDDT